MYKLCKTEQSARRQRDFELALLHLMEHKNYFKITITDLCKEMNAPRKAFYRYFDSVDDVLDALLDYEYLESMKGISDQNYESFFLYWSQNRLLLDILEKYSLSPRLISRAGQMILLKYLDSAKNLSLNEMQKISFSSSEITLMILWHHNGMKQSPKEMSRVLEKTFPI